MTRSRGRRSFVSASGVGHYVLVTGEIPGVRRPREEALAEGDKVACLMEYRGTHATFKREAVWREIWIVRLSEGKIVEIWPLPDEYAYLRQLGYLARPSS